MRPCGSCAGDRSQPPRGIRAHGFGASGGASRAYRPYIGSMITFLTVLVVIGMIGTVGTLFAGMIGIARPGSSPKRSNRLMQFRVIFQGATLLLFMLLLLLLRR